MTVDAHHHLWLVDDPGTEWLSGDGLEPLRRDVTAADAARAMTGAGITAAVVVEARSSMEETVELLALAACTGPDAGTGIPSAVVGWLDVAGDVPAQLEALDGLAGRDRLVGVRHQVQGESEDWLARPDVRQGLADLGAAGLVFDLVVRPDQLTQCAAVARALPDVTFVLDHLGKPPIAAGGEALAAWATDLADLATCLNVVAKASGLVTEADWETWTPDDLAPVIASAIETFGAERLLFGSDWPVCELAATYEQVITVARTLLADLDTEAVFDGNARRVYGLAAPTLPESR